MPSRSRLGAAGILTAASASLCCCTSVSHAPGVAAGYISHELCSGVFVSGQDPKAFYDAQIAPIAGPMGPLVSHSVNRERGEASASVAGLATRTAVYRGPLGCIVTHGPPPGPVTLDQATPAKPLLAPIAGREAVTPINPALAAAIDRAFAENPGPPLRQTKAVVVVHDGVVVGERYAPGYGVDVPMQGWSMSKSVTNALIGVLVQEGKLRMDAPAPVAAWGAAGDPRHAITLDNLLRMTSGLKAGNSLDSKLGTAFDPTAYMNFDVDDMAAFAEAAPLGDPPDAKWNYSNANTMIVSRIIRDQAGGDAASVIAFARRELFDKLGMTSVVMETDAVGTPIGSSHFWATPRDWAKLGVLFIDDGVVGGERILPQGWTDYSARLTPGSEAYGYGAGFWTNRGAGGGAGYRRAAGMPSDSYFARGTQGQVVVIVPSAHLVIVRMGFAFDDRGDVQAIARLTREAIEALKGHSA